MKRYCLAIISVILISCHEASKVKPKLNSKTEYGNFETDRKFTFFKNKSIVVNDSLKDKDFLNQKYQVINCKSRFISENDFSNEKDKYFIRDFEITISDTLKIHVLQKQSKLSEYVYLYNDKPFKIKNYFGEMFGSDSDLFFDFEDRKCYKVSESKFIMREQPARWCGLANQFDFFQIIDLQKMEIIQFVEKDEKIKRQT